MKMHRLLNTGMITPIIVKTLTRFPYVWSWVFVTEMTTHDLTGVLKRITKAEHMHATKWRWVTCTCVRASGQWSGVYTRNAPANTLTGRVNKSPSLYQIPSADLHTQNNSGRQAMARKHHALYCKTYCGHRYYQQCRNKTVHWKPLSLVITKI